jgi:NAD(P)-dependent dehydrogenase (short-subunit alcohol dehydrogenase family)
MNRWGILPGVATLTGKTAIVTGASRGIGLAIARALITSDVNVMITGTKQQPLTEAVRGLGAMAMAQTADVRDYASVERAFSAAAAHFGGIDILINNAGVGVFTPVANMSVEQWHAVIDTNLTGVFYCCRAVLPHLKKRGGGWIVNISSLAGKNAFPEAAAYCASKSGLNAFSEALMQEVRHDGIRVAYVMPGSVNTNFGGHQTAGADWKLSPDDVAEVVVDLLAHPARSLPSRVEIRPARPPKKG